MIAPGIIPPLPSFRGRVGSVSDCNAANDGWSFVEDGASNGPGAHGGVLLQITLAGTQLKRQFFYPGWNVLDSTDRSAFFTRENTTSGSTWSDWAGQMDTPWTAATIGTDWTDVTTYGGTRYRRVGGVVQLVVEANSAGGLPTIFTLPSGYRPSQDLRVAAFAMRTGTAGAALIITSGGAVQISFPTGGSTYQVFAQFPLKVT